MKRLIKKILKEDRRQMYIDKIVQIMKNDCPLFKNMELYGFTDQLSEDEINYVLSGIFGENGNMMIMKNSDKISIYNQNGNKIYSETSNGYWYKSEYDENNKIIYWENFGGFWRRWEYDNNSNIIYYEDSNGFWEKYEYDDNGNRIYRENSNGYIEDYR